RQVDDDAARSGAARLREEFLRRGEALTLATRRSNQQLERFADGDVVIDHVDDGPDFSFIALRKVRKEMTPGVVQDSADLRMHTNLLQLCADSACAVGLGQPSCGSVEHTRSSERWEPLSSGTGLLERGMAGYGFRPRARSRSKRSRPNSRASIDHAPGPSMARLKDSTARKA